MSLKETDLVLFKSHLRGSIPQAMAARPTRLIICVDGTWCKPDGPYGSNHGNITNVYRLCASIKSGECVDPQTNIIYNQQKKYYEGIGSETDTSMIQRLAQGVYGTGYKDMICEIYESCCKLPEHPQNEIWLYGFSRGAFVARAVAGLLHYFRALKSAGTPAFQKEYKKALELYRNMQRASKLEQVGQVRLIFLLAHVIVHLLRLLPESSLPLCYVIPEVPMHSCNVN